MESRGTSTDMDARTEARFGQIDERFERLEWRSDGALARLGKRIDGVEAEVHAVAARIDGIDPRLDRRIEDVYDSLGRRMTESEVRLATAINNFAGTLHDVHRLLQDRLGRRQPPDHAAITER